MKLNKKLIIGFLLFFILMILFSYQLVEGFNYDNDFGRDIYDILGIVQGKFRLLGPRLSFGGFISGPYYYYLFAIPLFLAQKNPVSLLYFSAFLYSLSFFVFYLFLNKKKSNFLPSLFFIFYLATSTYLLFSVRNPGNAFSYFWLIILFLIAFLVRSDPTSKVRPLYGLAMGFLAGIIINFHFVNFIIFFSFFLVLFFQKYKQIKTKLIFLLGIIFSFIPQFLFELRHNFVMIKNTFLAGSYQRFINKELVTSFPVSNNIFTNFLLLREYINSWMQVDILFLIITVIVFFLINRKKLNPPEIIMTLTTILSSVLLLVLARYQFAFHYFLPFILLWQLSLFIVIKQKKLKTILLLVFLLFNLNNFPIGLYHQTPRHLAEFENFSLKLIKEKFINAGEKFNIFIIRETPEVVAGWEYRFFLKKAGYDPRSPFEYNVSDKMLVIGEGNRDINLSELNTWEFEQFGEHNVKGSAKISDRNIVLLEKE